MNKIVGFAKTLRRHWKKSIFFAGVLAYGTSYGFDRYKTFEMMRAYCKEAKKYGEQPLNQMAKPKHVTVILNPEANDKKANVQFEKFVAPLLHLAGFKVSVFQTEFTKQAEKLMDVMSNTDAVIVAGGNGTLHEVITGMLNRSTDEEEMFPLGIIPLGRTNTVANYLFGADSSSRAQLMAEATMAVIKEKITTLDVLKVQFSSEEKPVYGLCQYEQGAFAEVEPLVKKYWYLGPLKNRFTYLRYSSKRNEIVENPSVSYVVPCKGCSKCYVAAPQKNKQEQGNRWWHAFIPRSNNNKAEKQKDYSTVINDQCGQLFHIKPFYLNLSASTGITDYAESNTTGRIFVKSIPEALSIRKFISSGIYHQTSKTRDDPNISHICEAGELIIEAPDRNEEDEEKYCYVDNEKYPRTSVKITLIPDHIVVYG